MRLNERICDHFENPRHLGELPGADVSVRVGNPVCGDTIVLQVSLQDGALARVAWRGYGCSTALAMGSLLAESLSGRSAAEVAALGPDLPAALLGEVDPDQRHCIDLGADVLARLAAALAEQQP